MEIDLHNHHQILSSGSRLAYQFFVILAMLIGGWLIRQDSEKWTLSTVQRYTLLGIAFVGALAGSAIPAFFSGGLVEDLAWSVPITPKTVMGGILTSFILVAIYKKITRNHVDTSDGFARGAIAMMAIGRIGCIFQHCCYGKEASWGLNFGDGLARIPVQYFEAIGLFGIFYLIQHLHEKNLFAGRRLFIVFALYGVLRFTLEFGREQIANIYFGIGFYQWIALIILATGLWQIMRRSSHPPLSHPETA
jgi:prolipoprotein diacylglyceryltransferase